MEVPLSVKQEHSHTECPQSDGTLNNEVRIKLRYDRQLYVDRTDPIVFLPVVVRTSGRVYDDFVRLIFLHSHRESSILVGELPEESEQFHFFRAGHLTNLKGSVGLIFSQNLQIKQDERKVKKCHGRTMIL